MKHNNLKTLAFSPIFGDYCVLFLLFDAPGASKNQKELTKVFAPDHHKLA